MKKLFKATAFFAASLLLALTACKTNSDDGSSGGGGGGGGIPVTGIKLSETSVTVAVGAETGPLSVIVTPENASNKTVSWSCSDTNVASIDKTTGKIKGLSKGTTTITATANDGSGCKATCSIIVNKIINLSEITENITIDDGSTIIGTLSKAVQIKIADGATVTLNGVSINPDRKLTGITSDGITCEGDAIIILADGSENTVVGMTKYTVGNGGAGIYIPSGKTLTVKGSTGILIAKGASMAAGIGGNASSDGGNIIIEGGVINATGQTGIGGGYSDCGDITIKGGTITATPDGYSAAIGASGAKKCGNILIEGGTVTATAGGQSAAIGGGSEMDVFPPGGGYSTKVKSVCGNITITNTVTKITVSKSASAPGPNTIGAGKNSDCGTVTIGGVVGAITESPYTYQP